MIIRDTVQTHHSCCLPHTPFTWHLCKNATGIYYIDKYTFKPCIASPSATMVLIVQDKQVSLFHKEGFNYLQYLNV